MRVAVDRDKQELVLTDDFGDGNRTYVLPQDVKIQRMPLAGNEVGGRSFAGSVSSQWKFGECGSTAEVGHRIVSQGSYRSDNRRSPSGAGPGGECPVIRLRGFGGSGEPPHINLGPCGAALPEPPRRASAVTPVCLADLRCLRFWFPLAPAPRPSWSPSAMAEPASTRTSDTKPSGPKVAKNRAAASASAKTFARIVSSRATKVSSARPRRVEGLQEGDQLADPGEHVDRREGGGGRVLDHGPSTVDGPQVVGRHVDLGRDAPVAW